MLSRRAPQKVVWSIGQVGCLGPGGGPPSSLVMRRSGAFLMTVIGLSLFPGVRGSELLERSGPGMGSKTWMGERNVRGGSVSGGNGKRARVRSKRARAERSTLPDCVPPVRKASPTHYGNSEAAHVE